MRRFSQRKQRNSKRLLLIIYLVLFLLALFSLAFKSGLFNIKKIEINLDKNLACVNEEQIKNASFLLGQNLFLTNGLSIEKNIKNKFVCIKRIILSKLFPNKVRIEVLGREPVAILMILRSRDATSSAVLENIATPSAEASDGASLVDRDGVIFSKDVGNLDIPKIYLLDNHNLENSLKILDKAQGFGLDIKTIAVLDNSFIIFSTPKIVFRLDSNIDSQIASLQLILERAKIDSEKLEFIDLRFDKPIIKIAPKKNG